MKDWEQSEVPAGENIVGAEVENDDPHSGQHKPGEMPAGENVVGVDPDDNPSTDDGFEPTGPDHG